MRKTVFGLVFVSVALMTISLCRAQEWATIYSGSDWDEPHAVDQTSDGGYIVAGETASFRPGYREFWILKLNSDGTVAWQKTYGGTDPREDAKAWSIQQTTDGGYVVAGWRHNLASDSIDYMVLKLDASGGVVWGKTYGGNRLNVARCVAETADGGYVVAGTTRYYGAGNDDFLLLKLGTDGSVDWQKAYGGADREQPYSVQQTTDGGYVVAGFTHPSELSQSDMWILRLSADGNVVWQKTYDGNRGDQAYSIRQTTDGGFIVAGITNSLYRNSPTDDIWVLKLYDDGTVEWEKSYGGDGGDMAWCVRQTGDGGYIVAGATATRCFSAGCSDFWLLKLGSDGTVAWERAYGGNYCDYADMIEQTTDGGYVVAGDTASFGSPKNGHDFLVLKLDSNGEIPGCKAMRTTQAGVVNTVAAVTDTAVFPNTPSVVAANAAIFVQDTVADVREPCFAPYVDDVEPSFNTGRRIGGKAIKIIGDNFGDTQGGSVVHINGKTYDAGAERIKIWSDSLIKIRTPAYACDRYNPDGFIKRKLWLSVDGQDSNLFKLKLKKPETCGP